LALRFNICAISLPDACSPLDNSKKRVAARSPRDVGAPWRVLPPGRTGGLSGIAPLRRKLRFLDNSKKRFAEIYGCPFLGLVVLVVLP
jgi:hypothetical protein